MFKKILAIMAIFTLVSPSFANFTQHQLDDYNWAKTILQENKEAFEEKFPWSESLIENFLDKDYTQESYQVMLDDLVSLITQIRSKSPQETRLEDDFYAAINKKWLDETKIPEWESSISPFSDMEESIKNLMITDLDNLLDESYISDKNVKNTIEFYRLLTNKEQRENPDYSEILDFFSQVDQIETIEDLQDSFAEFTLRGSALPIYLTVEPTFSDPSKSAITIYSPLLTLQDHSIYDASNEDNQDMLNAYINSAVNWLKILWYSEEESQKMAAESLAIETIMANSEMPYDMMDDYNNMNTEITSDELREYSDSFDLTKVIDQLAPNQDYFVVGDYYYMDRINDIINEENLEKLKSYIKVNELFISSFLFDEEFKQATAEVSSLLIWEDILDFEDANYETLSSNFSYTMWNIYWENHFWQEAVSDMEEIVKSIRAELRNSLESSDWMSDQTRKHALDKIDNMKVYVGYDGSVPRTYDVVNITPYTNWGTVYSNTIDMNQAKIQNLFNNVDSPKDEYFSMPAFVVNAMYDPMWNSIVFPAAIINWFYDPEDSISEQYAEIAVTIWHEMTHWFDPSWSQFDKDWKLSQWWTDEDYAVFNEKKQSFIDYFNTAEYAWWNVDWELTVWENVADAGGIKFAIAALKNNYPNDYNLDEFFRKYAEIWRTKETDDIAQYYLENDEHAPAKIRVNYQLKLVDDFYDTYDVQEWDWMYLAPEDRVSIW